MRWNKIVDRTRTEAESSNSDLMKKWVLGQGENAPWVKIEIDEPASWESKKPGYYVKSSGSLADRLKTQRQAMGEARKRKAELERNSTKHHREYIVKYNYYVGDPAHGGSVPIKEKVVTAASQDGARKKFKQQMDLSDYNEIMNVKNKV